MRDGLGLYILEGHRVVAEPNLFVWSQWMENAERVVARTEHELFVVSTVFLGLDHRHWKGKGPPIVFESMLFVDGEGLDTQRYSSWDDALVGHKTMVLDQMAKVRASAKVAT